MDEKKKQLIEMMQAGDQEAFDRVYGLYANKLYRTACLISGNKEDSEDILQETFVKCFLHSREVNSPEYFEKWLMKIMIRTSWRVTKQRKATVSTDELLQNEAYAGLAQVVFEDKQTAGPLDRVVTKEEQATVMDAVKSLDIKLRTVIVLYYYEELSVREIAELTGSLEGTIKSRLHTARTKLKKQLERTGEPGIKMRRMIG